MKFQKKSVCLLLHVIIAICAREPSSPICSKYDYEERLLETVFRNELALETTLNEIMKTNAKVMDALKQLEDGKTKVESTLAVIEQKQNEMDSAMIYFINNSSNNINLTLATSVGAMVKAASDIKANATVTVQQLVNEVRILKDQIKVHRIYFHARITASQTDLSSGQDVVFPSVDVNEGQGYNLSTGKFTASIPGMYLFSVQYCVYGKKYVYIDLVHNGKTIQRSANNNIYDYWPCLTMLVSAVIAMGNQVWVLSFGSTTLHADSNKYT